MEGEKSQALPKSSATIKTLKYLTFNQVLDLSLEALKLRLSVKDSIKRLHATKH